MDKYSNDDHGQIPESSQYIPDSTLIPQSEQMYPEADDKGDAHASYGDGGLPGGSGTGVETFASKKPGFLMKNLPLIVVVVAGAGIGGSFLYKKVLHPVAPIQTAVQSVPQAVEHLPEQPKQPTAVVEAQPVQAAQPAVAEEQKPNAVTQPVAPTALPQPVVPAQPESVKPAVAKVEAPVAVPPKVDAPAAVTAPIVAQPAAAVAPVVTQTAPIVDTRSAKELDAERRKSEALQSELLEMRARMATLETQLHTTRAAPVNVSPAARPEQSAPSYEQKPANHPAAAHVTHHGKHVAHNHVPVKKAAPEQVSGYSVTAVRNSLAWINTPNGTVTVREGDTLPGVGRVTKISEGDMRVSAGNKFVK